MFSNQVIRDSRNSQANSNGNKDRGEGNKNNDKHVDQHEEELNRLNQQLAEKDTTIKKIEQRWKQVQD